MNFWRRTNETDKKPVKSVYWRVCILASHATLAQTFRAADVHPADYPNVVAVKHMGEKLSAATDGRLEIKTFLVAC